jgi:hypothetical protein
MIQPFLKRQPPQPPMVTLISCLAVQTDPSDITA